MKRTKLIKQESFAENFVEDKVINEMKNGLFTPKSVCDVLYRPPNLKDCNSRNKFLKKELQIKG